MTRIISLVCAFLILATGVAKGASYVFYLDNIQIDRTRARHNDTVHVSFSVKIGDKILGPEFKHLGDKNNGEYGIGIKFGPVEIPSDQTKIVINYVVVNAGHKSDSEVEQAVRRGVSQLYGKVFGSGGLGGGDVWTQIGSALVGLGMNVLFADCDGLTATDQISLTGADLSKWENVHREDRLYNGTDSAVGCGANSIYRVRWQVNRSSDVIAGEPAKNIPYRIESADSLLFLDVFGALVQDGGRITQANTPEQKWELLDAGDGYVNIRSTITHLHLDVYAGNFTHGARVCEAKPNGSDAQKWQLQKGDQDGFYYIVSKGGKGKGYGGKDLCLDVVAGVPTIGSDICIATKNWPQAWGFVK